MFLHFLLFESYCHCCRFSEDNSRINFFFLFLFLFCVCWFLLFKILVAYWAFSWFNPDRSVGNYTQLLLTGSALETKQQQKETNLIYTSHRKIPNSKEIISAEMARQNWFPSSLVLLQILSGMWPSIPSLFPCNRGAIAGASGAPIASPRFAVRFPGRFPARVGGASGAAIASLPICRRIHRPIPRPIPRPSRRRIGRCGRIHRPIPRRFPVRFADAPGAPIASPRFAVGFAVRFAVCRAMSDD